MKRFVPVVLALAGAPSLAQANVEVGGTAGAHVFSDTNKLGVVDTSKPMPDSQKNSALFGLRLGFYFNDKLGVEVEGGTIPSEPRSMVFDVWNAAYRGQVVYQFRSADPATTVIPFVLGGAGIVQVVSTNNADIIKKDSEPTFFVGVGSKYRAGNDWGVRADLRVLIVPASGSGVTEDFEVLLGLYKEFGRKHVSKFAEPDKEKAPAGGAGGADPDKDGITGAADKCPNEAEDKDGFQDDDGCPDPDNDNDGVPDAADKCPTEAETKNGYQDEDGCPDEVPEKVKSLVGVMAGVQFKGNTADLAPASNKALDKVVAALNEVKDVKVEIAAHTDDQAPPKGSKFADNMALSQARADSVKAYLVSKGIDEGRITAKGYGDTQPVTDPKDLKGGKLNAARLQNRRVELKLATAEAAPAPAAAPAPQKQAESPAAPAPAPEKK